MSRKFVVASNGQLRRLAGQLPKPLRCTACGTVVSPERLIPCQCLAEWELVDE